MPIESGRTYIVQIVRAITSKHPTGTLSLFLGFACEEGQIGHDLWISEKAKERSRKDLITIGIDPDSLKKLDFWRNPTPYFEGKTCKIVVEDAEYNGKVGPKVKWINSTLYMPPAAPNEVYQQLADMFGTFVATDEDLPF